MTTCIAQLMFVDDSLISEIFGDERLPQGPQVDEYEADSDSEKDSSKLRITA